MVNGKWSFVIGHWSFTHYQLPITHPNCITSNLDDEHFVQSEHFYSLQLDKNILNLLN
ncbi:MAG: hypothetical protein QNJ47_16445 [Nostocaceae cyanobacterium]|nr:hypothetical protein [Nostocaceae cyanobacterium]